jgi:rhamnulokinase
MPDLFHYLLSGTMANELTIASTSQMLDPHSRTWNTKLLDALGIPHHFLGKIIPPGTQVGTLLPDLAKDTGLSPNTPIIAPGGHDTASAVAAVPVAEGTQGWCYLSSGTWSLMGVESPDPVVNAQTLMLNYTNEQGIGERAGTSKVRLLKNIMGLWLVQETRRDLQRQGKDLSYAELTTLAAAEPPLRTILNTWDPRFAAPGDFLNKIRAYARETNQPVPETPGQYVRACLDSLALAYRLVLGNLETLTSRRIDTIHIVGGGTQNELLNQLTADACQRTVFAGPIEATALGNFIIQALATHTIPTLAKGREIIANSFPLKTYAPQNTDLYANASKLFETLATP